MNKTVLYNTYSVINKIATGTTSILYHAQKKETGEDVCIKILKPDKISLKKEDLVAFQSTVVKISQLRADNIIKVLDTQNLYEKNAVITGYFPSWNLREIIQKNKELSLDAIVHVLSETCKALIVAHENNIVHLDLRPGHVLIASENYPLEKRTIKIIDFGIAAIRDLDRIAEQGPVLSILGYMAPEQFEENGEIDQRSDLYSLGVIFYELLTGIVPFQADNAASLVNQHKTKQPRDPRDINSSHPEVITNIVMKLLEKDPRKRYQSARGLLCDLELFEKGREEFVLGTRDEQMQLTYETGFIDRIAELEFLKIVLARTAKNNGGVVFVHGEAGVGKSRLLTEFVDYVRSKSAFSVLVDRVRKNNEPCRSIKNMLKKYSTLFGGFPFDKREAIQHKLENEYPGFIEKMKTGVIDLREMFLTGYANEEFVDSDNKKLQFQNSIASCFLKLSQLEGGMLLVFDDFHNADVETFELIDEISQNIGSSPLMIVCACDVEELRANNYLMEMTHDVLQRRRIKHLALHGFNETSQQQLLSDILHDKGTAVGGISAFIYKKSQGNPSLTIEILKRLTQEYIVYYQQGWKCDAGRINELKLPGNMIKVSIENLHMLSEDEHDVLSLAAVALDNFSQDLLDSYAAPLSPHGNDGAVLKKMIALSLMKSDGDAWSGLSFAHERLRRSVYVNIPEEKRIKLHLLVATYLEKLRLRLRDYEESLLFAIARHYMASGDKEKIIEYAIPAGLRAVKNFSTYAAIDYFEVAKKTLKESPMTAEKLELCDRSLASLYLAVGRYDEAIELYRKRALQLKNKNAQANAYMILSEAYRRKGDFANCERTIREALLLYNESIPLSRYWLVPLSIKEVLQQKICALFKIKNAALNTEHYRVLFLLLDFLASIFQKTDQIKAAYYIVKSYSIAAAKLGPSTELLKSLSRYGLLWSCFDYLNSDYGAKALEMSVLLGDSKGRAYALQQLITYNNSESYYPQSIAAAVEAAQLFRQFGDIKEAAVTTCSAIHSYFYSGDYQKAEEQSNACLIVFEKTQDTYYLNEILFYKMMLYFRRGEFERADAIAKSVYEKSHSQGKKTGNWQFYSQVNIILAKIAITTYQPDRAISYLVKVENLLKEQKFSQQLLMFYYCTSLESRIDFFLKHENSITDVEAKGYIKILKQTARKARISSILVYVKELNMLFFVQLGRLYALLGNEIKAYRFFEDAVALSNTAGLRYEHALAAYEYGRFLLTVRRAAKAQQYFVLAYTLFEKLGALYYVRRIQEQLGIHKTMKMTTENKLFFELKDQEAHNALLELNQYISHTDDVNQILDNIAASLLAITGAQRCLLFYRHKISARLRLKTSKSIYVESIIAEYPEELLEIVFINGKIYTSDSLFRDPLVIPADIEIKQHLSFLCVPAKYLGDMVGLCYVENSSSSITLSVNILDVVKSIVAIAAMYLSAGEPALSKKRLVIDQGKFKSICNKFALSDPEREIIKSVMDGYTNKELSKLYEISISAVKQHIDSVYQKMAITGREALIDVFTRS